MKNLVTFALISILALEGCGGKSDNKENRTKVADAKSKGTEVAPMTDEMTMTIPKPEILGRQIDRNGRPAINTALNHTFTNDVELAKAKKDSYNSASDPAKWGELFQNEIAFNLGVLDALDDQCGNQFYPGKAPAATDVDRYQGLAGVLANDRLWVDSTTGNCENGYLGVELVAIGAVKPEDRSCGGRALATDVIDISYSVLVNGTLSTIGDGVSSPEDFSAQFPYLAAPTL